MIPLKIQLRNFMCYRGEVDPLDFTGIHLACLTGDNGHGKSALLDAMTWAVWGRARAKRDDELITLGEQEMEVEFEFSLKDNHYRIIRKRDSRKRGRSILEFQVRHEEEFRLLTGPTIRETQKTINDILRMDYETFINSSFLLQGRADEFTIKPPAQRKQVLADILGLGLYDRYEQRAKELARARGIEQREIAARIQEMDRELANKPRYEQEGAEAQSGVEQAGEALAREQERLETLRRRTQELRLREKQLKELESRVAIQEKDLSDTERQIEEHAQRLAHYQQIVARRKEIEAGFERLSEARIKEQGLNQVLSQLLELNGKRESLERAIADAAAKLDTRRTLLVQKTAELKLVAAQRVDLEVRLSAAREKLREAAELEVEREEAIGEIRTLSATVAQLEAVNSQLREEMETLKERINKLQGASAVCPLCGQDLSADHRQRVLEDLERDGKHRGEQYRANRRSANEAKRRVVTLEKRSQELDAGLREKAKWQKQEGQLEQAVSDALAADQQLPGIEQESAELGTRLEAGDFVSQERVRLGDTQAQIAQLGYDASAHQALRQEIEVLGHFEAEKKEQETALLRIEEEKAALKNLRAAEERNRRRLEKDRGERDRIAQEIMALPQVLEQLKDAGQQVEALRRQEADARLRLGAARQRLEHCRYLEKERVTVLKRERTAAEEKGIYEELRLAFGKKGLQAMIIEAVIPEIEDGANALLARMTDGRMHVRFDTQRTTLKGDIVETLDISISDELGPRSYELYSGGEAFRVNFAIRIALSKLLARRAGAQLQTLIIDEGFGTQDAQGRERLVEAINAIRDDFARILVVTHIDELRDAFPTRIDVIKTSQGSRVYVTT